MSLIESDIILNSHNKKIDSTNIIVIKFSAEIFRLFLGDIDYVTEFAAGSQVRICWNSLLLLLVHKG
jgi:hypothetical protein